SRRLPIITLAADRVNSGMMNMAKLNQMRDEWGASHFELAHPQVLHGLPLPPDATELLLAIGLPTGPAEALRLFLRFENVDIIHQPGVLRVLKEADFETGSAFPRVGNPDLDTWIDLGQFVVLGEVQHDSGPGRNTRLLCVDGIRGNVWWVYPTRPRQQQSTDCICLNSCLTAYVASLLAYKQFR